MRGRTPGVIWTVITIGVLCMTGAALIVAANLAAGGPAPLLWRVVLAAAVFLIAETVMLEIPFGQNRKAFTMSETALVVGLVIVPAPWLVVVGTVAVAGAHMLAHRSPIKVAFNAMSCATGIVLARATLVAMPDDTLVLQAVALSAAALVFFVWNSLTTAGAVAASQRLPLRRVYLKGLPLCLLVWAGNVGTGLLLVALGSSRSPFLLVVPLLLALLYFLYWSYLRAMSERDLWQVLQATSRKLLRVEPEEVAHVVVTQTPALFSCDFVELLLVTDEAADSALVYRSNGPEAHAEIFDSVLRHSPFWGRMLAEREPFEIVAGDAPAAHRRELAALELTKYVVAPLLVQDRCLGTLRLGFRDNARFGDREMQVLTTYANHVSAAVHNTRLFETVRVQALHDPLTGLANRTLMLDRLEQARLRAPRAGTVAVLFLDLDRFKVVNDSMGHDAGDQLLVAVAQRIIHGLRPQDTAARFGGDEFVILCEDLASPAEAMSIAERLLETLGAPLSLMGQHLFISASIGVAITTPEDDDAAGLLRDADAAMYEAKAKGPARCELFDTRMRDRAVARLELENDLRRAVDRRELDVHYQPNVRVSDEGVVGLEALVRWNHPERGDIPPAEFIPLAEETGLIVPLGAWVIETACRQLADWTRRGCVGAGDLYVAVNISPYQLSHAGLVNHVAAVLMMTGVSPRSLCLEVTESALLDDLHGARDVLERLRRLGVRIALDDFGTGYSSLSYLQMLPVDILKLDRSFIARLSPDPRDRAVVAGMVDLAHALDLIVIAEGVETAQQLSDLRDLNCDLVQGFHYYQPQPAEDLDAVLQLDRSLRLSQTPVAELVHPHMAAVAS